MRLAVALCLGLRATDCAVCRRSLDLLDGVDATSDQLVLDRAYPTTDVQQRHALHALGGDGVDQHTGGRIRARRAVELEFLPRVGLVELGAGILAAAVGHLAHQG